MITGCPELRMSTQKPGRNKRAARRPRFSRGSCSSSAAPDRHRTRWYRGAVLALCLFHLKCSPTISSRAYQAPAWAGRSFCPTSPRSPSHQSQAAGAISASRGDATPTPGDVPLTDGSAAAWPPAGPRVDPAGAAPQRAFPAPSPAWERRPSGAACFLLSLQSAEYVGKAAGIYPRDGAIPSSSSYPGGEVQAA